MMMYGQTKSCVESTVSKDRGGRKDDSWINIDKMLRVLFQGGGRFCIGLIHLAFWHMYFGVRARVEYTGNFHT